MDSFDAYITDVSENSLRIKLQSLWEDRMYSGILEYLVNNIIFLYRININGN